MYVTSWGVWKKGKGHEVSCSYRHLSHLICLKRSQPATNLASRQSPGDLGWSIRKIYFFVKSYRYFFQWLRVFLTEFGELQGNFQYLILLEKLHHQNGHKPACLVLPGRHKDACRLANFQTFSVSKKDSKESLFRFSWLFFLSVGKNWREWFVCWCCFAISEIPGFHFRGLKLLRQLSAYVAIFYLAVGRLVLCRPIRSKV